MNTANSVNWFEIYVQDMARARAFYETVFGIRLEGLKVPDDPDSPGLEMLAFPGDMERYGANGALCRMPGVPSGPGGTLVYFACEDCAVEGARVAEAGGRIQREKMSIGEYGFIVLAFDTEGNMFGLHSMA
jgi:predicted enzyme related to lactoylglutathione lyase